MSLVVRFLPPRSCYKFWIFFSLLNALILNCYTLVFRTPWLLYKFPKTLSLNLSTLFPCPFKMRLGHHLPHHQHLMIALPSFWQNHLLKIYLSKVGKRKGYLMRFPQSFRMHWIHLPWVDFVVNNKGEEHQVKCMIHIFRRKTKVTSSQIR